MTTVENDCIRIKGARENNLKNIDIDIPHKKLVVITGLSGSGKSSIAFDIVYSEGQRRYVESMSAYIRQFLETHKKPSVDSILGLAPSIAIDQKTTSKNPRSTVGTMTEIYDYMRLLFARIGVPYSPATGLPIQKQTITEMISSILSLPYDTKVYILAPILRGVKGECRKELLMIKKRGFERVFIDEALYSIDDIPILDKRKYHNISVVVDRLVISNDIRVRLSSSIETALNLSDGLLYVQIVSIPEQFQKISSSMHETASNISHGHVPFQYINLNGKKSGDTIIFSEKFSCPESGFQIAEIEPRIFSFNTPFGACPECQGIGQAMVFDENLIVPNKSLSIKQGAISPWASGSKPIIQTLEALAKHYNFSLDEQFCYLPNDIQKIILHGSGTEKICFDYSDDEHHTKVTKVFGGVIQSLNEKYKKADTSYAKDELAKYMSYDLCKGCNGYRLRQESLCVKIVNSHIGEICFKTISEIYDWVSNLLPKLSEKDQMISERIINEIKDRLNFLIDVGLNYLNLSRSAATLSGGESQRIRLASQIGSGLTGVIYVLDEPSIGLHQRDNTRLIQMLYKLRDLGNTVVVVEHDEETMLSADYIIDVGIGAGINGGYIVAKGSVEDIKNTKDSITGMYLRREREIEVPKETRKGHVGKCLELIGARSNNLKNVNLKINLGTFTVVTGVSGGGKSTLIIDTLYKAAMSKVEPLYKGTPGKYTKLLGIHHIDKIIDINQSPIGRTPRSNPATYSGVFNYIRDWFANLPEAKARGYSVGRFSFNVKGGRCEACQGDGLIKIEMHFLPDIYVNCDVCRGKRYNEETLDIKYKDKSIADVLEMTVEEALHFFDKVPIIKTKMQTLYDVGIGYVKLGQSATTLSGGEAQRIKLSKELSKKTTRGTLYILDEPTTGLHVEDIRKLLKVLHKLVDLGNTVVVIEHNIDVMKTADYIIDIGPEGGDAGGTIVANCTIKEIMKMPNSVTGAYLKKYIE